MPGERTSKSHLEQKIWKHLQRRYPLTRWWWGEDGGGLELFPEWSSSAFLHEADEWRQLAQEGLDFDDQEVLHWGRFGRIVANRIHGGSFHDASEPLRQANLILAMVTMLDRDGALFPRRELLEKLSVWLSQVKDVSAADVWRRARTDAEAARLAQSLNEWDTGELRQVSSASREALEGYMGRVRDVRDDEDRTPWMASAHPSVDRWRQRRIEMLKESPIVQDRILTAGDILDFRSEALDIQEVVIPGLETWWLRPQSSSDLVIHGDNRDSSWAMAIVLAYWRKRSSFGPLTWALTLPPILEGGLMAAASFMGSVWPHWRPIQGRFFPRWLQRRRAMAMADAWLWLEDGEVNEVTAWLSRFLSKPEAIALIPWMKSHPGYYVMAGHVYNVLHDIPDGENWLWSMGPMMPDAVFLPEEE